jgi:outer membrane protein assembly factor BamB
LTPSLWVDVIARVSYPSTKAWVPILLAVCLGETSRAEDWPQWRGPGRNGYAASTNRVPSTLPAVPKVVWEIPVGAGLASPVIAGGKVFYNDNQQGKETLHALDAQIGREFWRCSIDDVFADEQGPSGPRCTPLVDADRVYAQSGKGELRCVAVADGHLLWRANFTNDFGAAFQGEDTPIPGAAEHGYTAAPVIEGDRLFACAGGTNGAGVVCFEKQTGKILWRSQNDRASYAAPIIATLAGTKQLICFTVEGLIGLALEDGARLWRTSLKTPYGRNCATPILIGDLVVVGSYRAGLVGTRVSRDGTTFKADRVWANKEATINFSSPVAVGRSVFSLGAGRQLLCVDGETGRTIWAQKNYASTAAEMAFASLLVVGGNLLVSLDDGQVALVAADPVSFREVGRVKLCDRNWCSPAYADGCLLIRDGLKESGHLYCFELVPR